MWNAELVEDGEIFSAVCGQVTKIGGSYIEVDCGRGKLRLLEVEVEGSIIPPSDLIRSIRKRLG